MRWELVRIFGGVLVSLALGAGLAAGASAATYTYGNQVTLPLDGLESPKDLAVDSAGALYVADISGKVFELPAGASAQLTLPITIPGDTPAGLAVDGQGDVFVGDSVSCGHPVGGTSPLGGVWELAAGSTGQQLLPCQSLKAPSDIAADNGGDVYAAESQLSDLGQVNGGIAELPNGSSSWEQLPSSNNEFTLSIAVDSHGDVFHSGTLLGTSGNTTAVWELSAGSATQVALPIPLQQGGAGDDNVESLAVDDAGDVFAAIQTYDALGLVGSRVVELPSGASAPVTIPIHGLCTAASVAVDSTGQHLIVGSGPVEFPGQSCAGQVFELDRLPATQLTYTGPRSGDFGDPVTLSATLTLSGDGSPVPGKTVSLGLGVETCSATTDSAGVASCHVTPHDVPSGSPYEITASFDGDDADGASSDSAERFTVLADDTALAYAGSTTGDVGDPVALAARLTDATDHTPIAGKPVSFHVGAESCQASTDAAGLASCQITPRDSPSGGPYPITASFAGDDNYLSASDVSRRLTVVGPPAGKVIQPGDGATYSLGERVAADYSCTDDPHGATIASCVGGVPNGSAIDTEHAGTFTFTVTARSSDGLTAAKTVSYTVAKAPTVLTLSRWVWTDTDGRARIAAVLIRADTRAPVVGEAVSFTAGRQQLCQARTHGRGHAECTFQATGARLRALGSVPYGAVFAGDRDFVRARAALGPGRRPPWLQIARVVVYPQHPGRCITENDAQTARVSACDRLHVDIAGTLAQSARGTVTVVLTGGWATLPRPQHQIAAAVHARPRWSVQMIVPARDREPGDAWTVLVSYSGDSEHGSTRVTSRLLLEAERAG